jgi:hypothetical protein
MPPPPNQQPFPPPPPWTNQTGIPNPTTALESQQRSTPPTPPRPSLPLWQWPAPLPPLHLDGVWDYIPEQVGRSIYDSLKILGFGLGAPAREIKLACWRLACLYHPDKWDQVQPQLVWHFKRQQNTFSYLTTPMLFFTQIFRLENRILCHTPWFPADVQTHIYHIARVQIYLLIFYFSSYFTAQKITYINVMKLINQSISVCCSPWSLPSRGF